MWLLSCLYLWVAGSSRYHSWSARLNMIFHVADVAALSMAYEALSALPVVHLIQRRSFGLSSLPPVHMIDEALGLCHPHGALLYFMCLLLLLYSRCCAFGTSAFHARILLVLKNG